LEKPPYCRKMRRERRRPGRMYAYLLSRVNTSPSPSPNLVASAVRVPSLPDLQALRELVEQAPQKSWTLARLADRAGYSPFHLLRAFRLAFHETPHRFVLRCRIDQARRLLAETTLSVTQICFSVGFESLGSFSTLFRQRVGWPPSAYRARVLAQKDKPLDFIPRCHSFQYGLDHGPQFSRSPASALG